MRPRKFFIYVEGDRDRRFFEQIIKPLHQEQHPDIEVIVKEHAQGIDREITKAIKALRMLNYDILLTGDQDFHPCFTSCKASLHRKFKLSDIPIIIVCKEIESWYFAGLTAEAAQRLRVQHFPNTDTFTKQQFQEQMKQSGRWTSDIDFREEILQSFSFETARQQNTSFRYFTHKLSL